MIKRELFAKQTKRSPLTLKSKRTGSVPLKLQFFAEGGEDTEGKEGGEGTEGKEGKEGKDNKEVDVEKVKAEARAEYLKTLGIESEEDLQSIVTKHNEDVKKNKTDLENKDDELKQTTKELVAERNARIKAEAKAEAMVLGAKPEMVDDLVVLAMNKVTKDKSVQEVLAEMKAGKNASNYFVTKDEEEEKKNKNKNKNVTNKRVTKGDEDNSQEDDKHTGSMAERLLANRKNTQKSHYFN